MNYKLNEQNPIEMIRISEKESQKNFAIKLGFSGKDQYRYHMNQFTKEIIDKMKKVYDQDLTIEIINYLKYENRSLMKKNKLSKHELKRKDLESISSKNSISSLVDNM